MPDLYTELARLDAATQERIAAVLEKRGADPQQREMRCAFLGDVPFPPRARVLEVGCGTGVLTRTLGRRPEVGEVVGVDPVPHLLARARSLAADLPKVSFQEADGRSLPFADSSFDVAVFDSVLSHLPCPERGLAEAGRVLRPGGWLAVFDGDYATTTVALGDDDPLQACVAATLACSVHDPWVVRRLPALVRGGGFDVQRSRSYGFVETTEGGYMLTLIDRGADSLRQAGTIGDELAAALKTEARRRVEAGTFFGHIAYGSLTARRPG
jgi:SAM-dependent methyltransferase